MMVSAGNRAARLSIAERPGVLEPGAEPARHARAHPGRAHVDHHRHAEPGDGLEQRVQGRLVDRVVPHDRVEVEAEHAVLADRGDRVGDRLLALERVDRPPAPMNVSGCRSRSAAT